MANEEKIFVKGMFSNKKDMGTWSVTEVSFKVEDFVKFLQENANSGGYVKVKIKDLRDATGKKNNQYCELDTWQPTPQGEQAKSPLAQPTQEVEDSDLPF